MNDPIRYLCGIDDPERLRKEALAYGVTIIKEQPTNFLGGVSGIQFIVEFQGQRGILAPTSPAAIARQAKAGRHVLPYCWVPI